MRSHIAHAATSKRPIRRILLLAQLPIGDTLFITPTIRALRDRYPAARITALVHSSTAQLLRRVPQVDEVIVFPFANDWRGWLPLLRTLTYLRAQRFDAAIDFTTPAYKWISFICGIPIRTYMKFDRLWWILPGRHRRWRNTHATRHYYDCARELNLPPWSKVSHAIELVLPQDARTTARLFLRDHALSASADPLVAIHPGGAGLDGLKRWPPERFAELADRLYDSRGARVILVGGADEVELANAVASRMRHRPVIAAGAVPLLASIALIEACDLFIGNDSALLHAAAALGVPYVGVFGPTSPINFHPVPARPRQGHLVLPPFPCRVPQYFVGGDLVWRRRCCRGTCAALAAVTVDAVFAQADTLLQERLAPADVH